MLEDRPVLVNGNLNLNSNEDKSNGVVSSPDLKNHSKTSKDHATKDHFSEPSVEVANLNIKWDDESDK